MKVPHMIKVAEFYCDQPRGQVDDLVRFALGEVRAIQAEAREKRHVATVEFCTEFIEELREARSRLARLPDPEDSDTRPEGETTFEEDIQDTLFQMTLETDWEWLMKNWKSVLPSSKQYVKS